jgi:glucosamine-6-phosphate deaminase
MKTADPHTAYEPGVILARSESEFAFLAALDFIAGVEGVAAPLVVFPAGNTPLGLYRELSEKHRSLPVWQTLRYLSLDEYAGLPPDDPRLFANWIGRELLDRAGVAHERRLTFRSDALNEQEECARMEMRLAESGPPDLAILGLGLNGHVGFNEPGSAFGSRTRVVTLSPESAAASAAYWEEEEAPHDKAIPATAYTLGLATLAQARRTILLVSGAQKADILHRVLTGPIGPEIPATYLRTIPNVTIIADRAALGKAAPDA